jgi:hypothetical protein
MKLPQVIRTVRPDPFPLFAQLEKYVVQGQLPLSKLVILFKRDHWVAVFQDDLTRPNGHLGPAVCPECQSTWVLRYPASSSLRVQAPLSMDALYTSQPTASQEDIQAHAQDFESQVAWVCSSDACRHLFLAEPLFNSTPTKPKFIGNFRDSKKLPTAEGRVRLFRLGW